jgi:hypothetical protein
VSHNVIITIPPPNFAPPPPDEPTVTFNYTPSHELTEQQQERQYANILKLLNRAIEVAKRGDHEHE